jgi:heme A synthase
MFRALSLVAAVSAFAVAVLGSWIRINGAGMTCPDWPQCQGQLVPVLEGGVVLEYSHRVLAAIVGLLVLALISLGYRKRREIAGMSTALTALAAVFALQVALGAATVALSNSPWSVVLHWGVAMLFLATLTAITMLAWLRPSAYRAVPQSPLFALLWLTTGVAFAVMCAGAFVSSSGAGLACSTLPTCDGGSWTGFGTAENAQMTHRLLAGALVLIATVVAYWASLGTTLRVRIAALGAYALIVLQCILGMANIALQLPHGLREAHAANAAATFIVFVCAIVFASIDGTVRERAVHLAPSPESRLQAQTQSQSQAMQTP